MNAVKNYLMYFVCVGLLFLFLFLSIKVFEKKNNLLNYKLYAMVNNYENVKIDDQKLNQNIEYPLFGYKRLDDKIYEFISSKLELNDVDIKYSVFSNKKMVSIFFVINEDGKTNYKNINFSIKNSKFALNNEILDLNVLSNEILDKIKYKYSTDIYNKVVEDNFKSSSVKVEDAGVYLYFNESLFDNVKHKVYLFMPNDDSSYVSDIKYDKVIAFTFDDGPSKYTTEIVKTLLLNDSKATFFELGNRMKYNQDIVKEVYNSGMEVASHTYAHKNLNKLSESEIDEEVNSTNIIFNEIVGANIPYVRPPYGNANSKVKSRISVPLINWSVDTEDWVSKDSDVIYNHILTHVEDGDILLMHDIYPETVEAVKKVLPVLREMGYKVTTVSELAREKNRILEPGVIYRSFKG